MSLLDKLERVLGRFAIPNISLYLVIGQVFVLLGGRLGRLSLRNFELVPALVAEGEWWRLLLFVFVPPATSYLFVAFALYLFYLMSNALEHYWGTFRFNLFLFVGYALTVGVAFLTPGAPATNAFIAGSVFLAFAYLNPDFELSLFFILPIKIKWLALVMWVVYGVEFVMGGWPTRFQVLASVGNFLLFFSADIVRGARYRQRSMARAVERVAEESKPRHVCHVCGKTDKTHPDLDFRYCSQCAGDQCYCPEHIRNHAHVVAPDAQKAE